MSGPVLEYQPADDRRAASRRRAVAIVVGLTAVATIVVAGYLLLPRLNRPRDEPTILGCASNLKQIGQAMLLYANENHDAMPPDFATLLENEDLVPEMFVCRSTNDDDAPSTQPAALRVALRPGSGHCSYVYIDGYARFSTLDPNDVIAFEPFGHHDDLTNVLFADGHVDRIDKPAADAIQRQYDDGTRPIRVPAGAP